MSTTLVRFGHGATPRLVVSGVSATNALAFNSWQLWAFLRAEMTAFAESPFRCNNGTRASLATIKTLHPKWAGLDRLIPIAQHLLDELTALLETAPPEIRIALVLCLPERMAEGRAPVFRAQRKELERELGAYISAVQIARGGVEPLVRTLPLGHSSMAWGLQEIAVALENGNLDVVFLGGLDTPHDPDWIDELLDRERLFDGENLTAAIPGEGGAFIALASRDAARRCHWPRLAEITAVATAREPATVDNEVPLMALGLSRCAVAATDHLEAQGRSLDWWISDMTAEPFRVQEFQLAWPRAAARRMRPESSLQFLATQLGDLGAAVMPTALALAIEGFVRKAPKADTCLITGSSVGGERGVVLVERAR